jgi:HlyD family secretion protein
MKTFIWILLVIGVLAGGGAYYMKYVAVAPPPKFRNVKVTKGDVVATIEATGPVMAENRVDVGAQATGRIIKLGPDMSDPEPDVDKKRRVDYTTIVHKGDLLAQIDPTIYQGQVDQARAALGKAQADLKQAEAKRFQAQQDMKRAKKLRDANERLRKTNENLVVISDTDYDLAVANEKVTEANVGVAKASIKQAQAALDIAETNLGYTTIFSTLDGVIIDRRVDIGQTVVSNLNVSSLFLIAKDLRRMEVWASVNEDFIGEITLGMPVEFTVHACPNDVFHGTVKQIRLNAQSTQNVVTYTVVIGVDNSDMKLKPLLTADVRFQKESHKNVLAVPNMALRWSPRTELISPDALKAATEKRERSESNGEKASAGEKNAAEPVYLWMQEGNYLKPIKVQVGITDGTQTEVSSPELSAGMKIVVGEITKDQDQEETDNPFAPKFFRRKNTSSQSQQKGPGGHP